MTSPVGIQQRQTDGRFIAELCDQVERKMLHTRTQVGQGGKIPLVQGRNVCTIVRVCTFSVGHWRDTSQQKMDPRHTLKSISRASKQSLRIDPNKKPLLEHKEGLQALLEVERGAAANQRRLG